ncbi:AAA family ATPase [Myxococcota bacterium]
MPIVTISRGSASLGKEVAELVAQKLDYKCVGRDVILEASDDFNIPELKLVAAVEDPPSILERFSRGKQRYIAYIRAALLRHFKEDDVVYHGVLGHYFLEGISHVVKVRVLADTELRVAVLRKRDNISEEAAHEVLAQNDKARRQWAMHLYGIDPADPEIYDLVVHVGKLNAEYAADTICRIAGIPSFQATSISQSLVEDLALEARLEALLLEHLPEMKVSVKNGQAKVFVKPARVLSGSSSEFDSHYRKDMERRILELTRDVSEIRKIEVDLLQ